MLLGSLSARSQAHHGRPVAIVQVPVFLHQRVPSCAVFKKSASVTDRCLLRTLRGSGC